MKALITLVLIAALYLFVKAIVDEYKAKQQQENATEPAGVLEGLPPQFEPSLQAAQAQGAPALKAWLERYRPYVRDPRLAAIELDYVVLVSRSNPGEARQVFQAVKRRTPRNSPVYERVKRLESTYGD